MWLKWFPWKFIIKRLARAQGFMDPVAVLTRLERFAQPSDVLAPPELLRAASIFHARGLINSRAIQHNLDWIWPYWITNQFSPASRSFIPRAFSLTHINLTHRNWTAVGLPDLACFPIVDPRGLVTPFYDGWSLDGWIVTTTEANLFPSRCLEVMQELQMDKGLCVRTLSRQDGLSLEIRTDVVLDPQHGPVCRIQYVGHASCQAYLVIALRPCNPEGVALIHEASTEANKRSWRVGDGTRILLSKPADRIQFSEYKDGDVHTMLFRSEAEMLVKQCNVGMVTSAALYEIASGQAREVEVLVPLVPGGDCKTQCKPTTWAQGLLGTCKLQGAAAPYQFLYDAALRTIVLHSPGTVYAGPYTYKRFWVRDATFVCWSLLCAGLWERAVCVLEEICRHQNSSGYFLTQDGEWDANGQALWIMGRYCELTGNNPNPHWLRAMEKGAEWIIQKRTPSNSGHSHAGLLPAGFSAEHLGPNDYYYWDDFWAVAGLRSASRLLEKAGNSAKALLFESQASDLLHCIQKSLAKVCGESKAMPASPHRRMDSGSVGSLVAGYPLQLWDGDDSRLLQTADYLYKNCRVHGAFYHDIIHSGINPYLSLHIAQVLLRAGDVRGPEIGEAIARHASPTGQWPEAIHPFLGTGCMGDGQHTWAAAEWISFVRTCFVREEANKLVLCSGLSKQWLKDGSLQFGPAPTRWGSISIRVDRAGGDLHVSWDAGFFGPAPQMEIRPPGGLPVMVESGQTHASIAGIP